MPFDVPEGWCWCTLPDLCLIPITDGTHQTPTYTTKEDGVPFISSKDVTSMVIDWSNIKYITKDLHANLYSRIAPQKYDILLAKNGTTGVAAMVEDDRVFDIYVTLAVIRPSVNIVPEFLLNVINSNFCKKQFNSHLTGIGLPNLHLIDINKTLIPLPPYKEQLKIVSKLNEVLKIVDALKDDTDSVLESIQTAKSKILDLAIHGKLVPQDSSDEPASELLKRINPNAVTSCDNPQYQNSHFEIPDSWRWCIINDLFEITMGQSPEGETYNNTYGIEFHQGKINFTEKYLDKSGVFTTKPTKIAKAGSILICVRAPVGIINITQREVCIGRGLCALKCKDIIDPDYAFYALQTIQSELESKATGSTFKAISCSIIRDEPLPLPPYEEQKRIVLKIQELNECICSILNQIEA